MLKFGLGHIHKGDFRMAKRHFQAEQILAKLREAEIEIISRRGSLIVLAYHGAEPIMGQSGRVG